MRLFFFLLILSSSLYSKTICVTTLFAPSDEIQGLNSQMLIESQINISHIVITEDALQLYGPKNPEVVSSRLRKRVLIAEHKITKIDDVTYNLSSSGEAVIRNAFAGDKWKFVLDTNFYKKYEKRAYDSIFSYCTDVRGLDSKRCTKFADDIFHAYVAPIANQGCIEI